MHKQCTCFLLPFLLGMSITKIKGSVQNRRGGGGHLLGGISPIPPLCINIDKGVQTAVEKRECAATETDKLLLKVATYFPVCSLSLKLYALFSV